MFEVTVLQDHSNFLINPPKIYSLRKIWKFHLISWCGSFAEKNRPKLCGNCAFPINRHTRKLSEIALFYAVICFINISLKLQNIISHLRKYKNFLFCIFDDFVH